MFKVTMYGQTFMVSTHSIKRILGMPPLTGQLSIFSLKVEALIRIELNSIPITLYAKFHPLSTHASIVDFTKSTWIFAMFLSYSFYFFFPIILRFVTLWPGSFTPFFLGSSLTSSKWSSKPWHYTAIPSCTLKLSYLPSLLLSYWRTLALSLILFWLLGCLVLSLMRALRPNIIAMFMVPWFL